jgi:hypothetical protein
VKNILLGKPSTWSLCGEYPQFKQKGFLFMGPREIMLEHIEFWTSDECPPMSQEDMELVKKLAGVLGVRVFSRLQKGNDIPEPVCQAAGLN